MIERPISLAGVPALLMSAIPAREAAAERGTVLLLHGFTGSKEVQRAEGRSLARRGYLSVITDAADHGARRAPDFDQRFAGHSEASEKAFFEIVKRTTAELGAIRAALIEEGLALPGRLGVCGISMGGAVLFGALAAGVQFDAAVAMISTPHWKQVGESPHEHPERFFPTPLLLQTAGADTVVPPEGARTFHETLTPLYASAPERLHYIEHPGEAHIFTPLGWARAWRQVETWFNQFLVAPGSAPAP